MNAPPIFDVRDPDWLAHRHVADADTLRFIHLPRAERSLVPFLTDANLGERPGPHDLPVAVCLAEFPKAPVRWLFHSAFCGSTMLAHGFDALGLSSSLSEPVLLNDVVGLRRRGGDPRQVARLSDAALRMLGRSYPGEQAVVLKPSNVANPLAELFLALQPDAPAVFLYAPLETFLISVARKGLGCRLWVRELLEGYLRENFLALGFEPNDYFRQSDLQVAAVGWLAQHAYFAQLANKLGPARLRALDADRMVASPREAVEATARHFRLDVTARTIEALSAGPAFTRHSKSGGAYSSEVRRADYAVARAAHAEEIDVVLSWAEKVAGNAGVALSPPHPLLDHA